MTGEDDPLELSGTPASLRPAGRIGRYVVIDELGEGGMGVVYTAYDGELDRAVAIRNAK